MDSGSRREMSQDGEREGVPLREAVHRLGVSERTVRDWIKRGKIEAWESSGKFGKEWRVVVPEAAPPVPDLPQTPEEKAPEVNRGIPSEVYDTLLHRHESAILRLGYLQAQSDQVKMLASEAESLKSEKVQAETQTVSALNAMHRLKQELEETRRRGDESAEAAMFYREIMSEMKDRAMRAEREVETLQREIEEMKAAGAAPPRKRGKVLKWLRG